MSTPSALPLSTSVKDVRSLSDVGSERVTSRKSLPTTDSAVIRSDIIMIAPLPGTEQGNHNENPSKGIFRRFIDAIHYIFAGGPLFGGLVDDGDGLIFFKPGLGSRIYQCIVEGCPEEEEIDLPGESGRAARRTEFQDTSDSKEEQPIKEQFDPSFNSEEIRRKQKEVKQAQSHQNPYL